MTQPSPHIRYCFHLIPKYDHFLNLIVRMLSISIDLKVFNDSATYGADPVAEIGTDKRTKARLLSLLKLVTSVSRGIGKGQCNNRYKYKVNRIQNIHQIGTYT